MYLPVNNMKQEVYVKAVRIKILCLNRYALSNISSRTGLNDKANASFFINCLNPCMLKLLCQLLFPWEIC